MTWSPKRAEAKPGSLLAETLRGLPAREGLSREFPPAVLAEAEAAAASPALPDRDATDIPFVTIDPPGATDLDQALALHRDGAGWIVHYAIADLPSFVEPGGAIDAEARRRGTTVYLPDERIPLHPETISEGAASLLPGRLRGAFLWEIRLGAAGEVAGASVERARVRSRAQLSYAEAQRALDTGTADAGLAPLAEVGEARLAQELARGGASLNSPETIVEPDNGGYRLSRRNVLPVERWNAQLSLLTGMTAARLMLDARIGVLRTMPPAEADRIAYFRRQTRILGVPWGEEPYGAYLRGLSGDDPAHLAIMHAAAALFRGAGYQSFDGELPLYHVQAAIAAPYAHVTAPLRRLVDRFGLEICAALSARQAVPAWVREALPSLPGIMAETGSVSGRLDRSGMDVIEAAVLAGRVGEVFDAAVVAKGRIQLPEPAVEARCDGADEPGVWIRARLLQADIATGAVLFEAAEG